MRRPTLDTIASTLMLAAAAAVLWSNLGRRPTGSPKPPVPGMPLSLADAHVKGNPNAKTALIVFSDFECPSCRQFALDLMPKLETDYVSTGRIKVAFKHLPLRTHAFATRAAEAAECAARQGKFWAYHDLLFSNQGRFGEKDLHDYARETVADADRFTECARGQVAHVVREAVAEAAGLKVRATPTFMVGVLDIQDRIRVTSVILGAVETALRRELDYAIESQSEAR